MSKTREQATSEPDTSGWERSIDKADNEWDSHDCDVREAVHEYDMHLSQTPGYVPLDWKMVKAILWVETGAKRAQWKTRPMQIGNTGDPGLQALLGNSDGGELILPPSYRRSLSIDGVRRTPIHNIRAGIGYLLLRMTNFSFQSVLDADTRTYDVAVRSGDNLSSIARAQGSTPEVMKKLNPSAHVLRPGDVLRYQKASIQRVITGWKPITASGVAAYYNAGGDAVYAKKLSYALAAVRRQAEAAACK
ncbi:LysM domain-containing protein [Variovorax sp. EL159]|uniref:LysM peptidoglycan-binding domain-containing protein n=1 Tax=Variovorax sp. EL159 TaxID=1566270 RepID=UPI000881C064|nr:LysM domain-containing protein [Variovorax sp. EL159]SCX56730.1 LysM domain-containing protein [Variovorax sp. EL159]